MSANTLAYVLVAAFFLYTEVFMRRGATARNVKAGAPDRGSTALIVTAYGVAILLPWLLDRLNLGWLPDRTLFGWIGLALIVLGISLRVWAMSVLGQYYTRTLVVVDKQRIVKEGPYRIVRHPGYLGSLLVWVGFSIAVGNWVVVVLVATLMIVAYSYRIRAEEAMLKDSLGEEYLQYAAHSWRLVPLIY